METPKNAQQIRTLRTHTPKLSERKKELFSNDKLSGVGEKSSGVCDELLTGIEPLSNNKTGRVCKTPKSTKMVETLTATYKKSPRAISFFETESEDGDTGEEQKPSPSRRSVRLFLKNSPDSSKSTSPQKENMPIKTPTRIETQETRQLQKMFNNSMQITPREKAMVMEETSSEDDMKFKRDSLPKKYINKRQCESGGSTGLSPMRKQAKITLPIDDVSISTKSFYAGKNKKSANNSSVRPSCRNLFGQTLNAGSVGHSKSRQTPRRSVGSQSTSINRGVHHKVRKRTNNWNLSNRHYAPLDIDQILNNVRNEKLRKIITDKREEKEQIEKIHSIFRKASNPIAMARPLSSISNQDDSNNNITKDSLNKCDTIQTFQFSNIYDDNTDFSDIECDAGVDDGCEKDNLEDGISAMNDEVIPLITHQDDTLSIKSDDSSGPVKRKFFKSGHTTTTRKEVYLTDNIKAMVTANGKLVIVPKKKVKKRIKIRSSVASEFSDEQATVDAILRNLDDNNSGDISLQKDDADVAQNRNENNSNPFLDEIDHQLALMNVEESPNIDDIVLQDNQDFNEFRKRLPYNTTDPEIIERQHLLLDFLITNNICTEDNFNIFITDPDNHKAEAERIIDELVIVVSDHQNTDFRQRIPYNTTDPVLIAQQHNFLDFLLEHNICTEENFNIFIANYNNRKAEATSILSYYLSTASRDTEKAVETTDYFGNNLLSQENLNSYSCAKQAHDTNVVTTVHLQNMNLSTSTPINSSVNINDITVDEPICQTPLTTNMPTNFTENMSSDNCGSRTAPHDIQNQSDQKRKLFPVFYPGGCQPLPQIFTRQKQQHRFWNAGYGSNQYQIDAGQKEFGAHQCKQCGLVYTVHEPEEEKLHRDFHASLHILRFKGWIDEDIVAIYPEWGPDGRILRITESSPPKRRERLLDILKIVDKELGFSSYIVPKAFVGYFAVRKMQIVGLCLVQPLNKANKYTCINGVDCCTEEQFEARCGISRIWVSPLHRRLHIGSKLVQAVQLNTIFGEEVPLDKIAFSAPTELGKAFAQKISRTENFLVYQ